MINIVKIKILEILKAKMGYSSMLKNRTILTKTTKRNVTGQSL